MTRPRNALGASLLFIILAVLFLGALAFGLLKCGEEAGDTDPSGGDISTMAVAAQLKVRTAQGRDALQMWVVSAATQPWSRIEKANQLKAGVLPIFQACLQLAKGLGVQTNDAPHTPSPVETGFAELTANLDKLFIAQADGKGALVTSLLETVNRQVSKLQADVDALLSTPAKPE